MCVYGTAQDYQHQHTLIVCFYLRFIFLANPIDTSLPLWITIQLMSTFPALFLAAAVGRATL